MVSSFFSTYLQTLLKISPEGIFIKCLERSHMLYNVDLITRAGYKENYRIEAASVDDASRLARCEHPGCVIREVTLIPQQKDTVVMYSNGEQYETPSSTMFEHFK